MPAPPRLRRLRVLLTAFVLSVLCLGSSAALADSTASQFGQVGRFGCYTSRHCSGTQFDLPVGFAVGAGEVGAAKENAVWVLERSVFSPEAGEVGYRLRKLASPESAEPGAVLGEANLPLQKPANLETEAHPLISLAVAPSEKRVYAVVESIVDVGGEDVPVADELVAWSTEPSAMKEPGGPKLVRAAGLPEDTITHASLVTSFGTASLSTDLYAPEALAIASDGDVVLEAQRGVSNGPKAGPPILQRISGSGQLDGSWVEPAADSGNKGPDGLVAEPDETFAVDLMGGVTGLISQLEHVSARAGKNEETAPAALVPQEEPTGKNRDEALSLNPAFSPNYREGVEGLGGVALEAFAAGGPIARLSGGEYAAGYGEGPASDDDFQSETWGHVPYFWLQEGLDEEMPGNMGIRIFNGDGSIRTTIGGGAEGKPCNLNDAQLAIAAGANNSLFVLTSVDRSEKDVGDEVIEFAEGKGESCPQPQPGAEPGGELSVNGAPVASASVAVGAPVEFNATSIGRAGESPFKIEWDFGEEGKSYELESKIEAPEFKWPNPAAEHKYEKVGTYTASARITGDYGVSVFPVTVQVETDEPVAEFMAPSSATVDTNVEFSASGSKPTPGSKIKRYRWNFGDGSEEKIEPGSTVNHEYTGAGAFEATLTIEDTAGHSASKVKKIVVAEAGSDGGGGSNTGGGGGVSNTGGGGGSSSYAPGPGSGTTTTATTTATNTATTTTTQKTSSPTHPLTQAQKLAGALKTCHKLKSKKRRLTCESSAKHEFGPKKTHKHDKKKK